MILLEGSGLQRDGTRWRRSRERFLMKAAIFPRADEVYYGLGKQPLVPGFMYIEHEGYARSVQESFVERVEERDELETDPPA